MTITPSLEAGKSYQYQVRAQDGAGNWSAWKSGPATLPSPSRSG
jgi:hypothetical protein